MADDHLLSPAPSSAPSSSRRLSSTSRYGSLTSTLSASALDALLSSTAGLTSPNASLRRSSLSSASSSFSDLPPLALSGLGSRVSVSGSTSASKRHLADFFSRNATLTDTLLGPVPAVRVSGGYTRHLLLSAAGALASSFAFGMNNANMNTPAAPMRLTLGIPAHLPHGCRAGLAAELTRNSLVWSFLVSVLCLSALLGSLAAGSLADAWGRRQFLLGNSGLYLGAAALGAAAALFPASGDVCSPEPSVGGLVLLLCSRVLAGLACGGSTVVVPMYLGEIAPAHLRGTLGAAFLLTAVTGMLAVQAAGLSSLLGTRELWPLVQLLPLAPAAAQLLLLAPFLLESPRWLLMCGRDEPARLILAQLRGCGEQGEDADELLDELTSMMPRLPASAPRSGRAGLDVPMLDRGATSTHAPMARLFIEPSARRPLVMCVTLMALQQFSGINNAFNYSSTFLALQGVSEADCALIAILMNLGNVAVVLVSTMLMDRAGRKPLLCASLAAMAVACVLLTFSLIASNVLLVCVSMVIFVMGFGIGLGPVAWLLPAELFSTELRASATTLATGVNWLSNYCVGQVFLVLAQLLGSFSFLPFAAILIAGLVFAQSIPETRGKTLEDIESYFKSVALGLA